MKCHAAHVRTAYCERVSEKQMPKIVMRAILVHHHWISREIIVDMLFREFLQVTVHDITAACDGDEKASI